MLQNPETLQTHEEYARESFYEAEGDQPLPTNATNRRHQQHGTQDPRQRRTTQSPWDQARTSSWATGMDVDHGPREQGTPPGTPFDDGFTPSVTTTKPQQTPQGEFIRITSSPPSTRSLKKLITPTSTPPIHPLRQRPPRTQRLRPLMRRQQPKQIKWR